MKVNFASRLEFQDGKSKEATQDYHGRGAVHLHGLIFAKTIGPMQLETKLSATLPPEDSHLRGVVLDRQAGRTGSSWPVRDQENAYADGTDRLVLRHTAQDKLLGIRAYIPEVMDVLKCLMDSASSAYGAARRVLFTFHSPGRRCGCSWRSTCNRTFSWEARCGP